MTAIFRENVNAYLPHTVAISRTACQANQFVFIICANCKNVKFFPLFTKSILPLISVEILKIRRSENSRLEFAGQSFEPMNIREKVLRHKANFCTNGLQAVAQNMHIGRFKTAVEIVPTPDIIADSFSAFRLDHCYDVVAVGDEIADDWFAVVFPRLIADTRFDYYRLGFEKIVRFTADVHSRLAQGDIQDFLVGQDSDQPFLLPILKIILQYKSGGYGVDDGFALFATDVGFVQDADGFNCRDALIP